MVKTFEFEVKKSVQFMLQKQQKIVEIQDIIAISLGTKELENVAVAFTHGDWSGELIPYDTPSPHGNGPKLNTNIDTICCELASPA
jgi:hypothetical protein